MMDRPINRRTALSGISAMLCFSASPALAQMMDREERQRLRQLRRQAIRRFRQRGGGLSQRARSAIARGEIQPLRTLFMQVRQKTNVEVLDVDLHETPEKWIYALRVLTPQGRVQDLFFDARSLELLVIGDNVPEGGIPLPPGLGNREVPPAPAPAN